jgi:hypothetical protein
VKDNKLSMFTADGERILIPDELYKIGFQTINIDAHIQFMYIFSTGVRVSEYNYVLEHPDMIDYENRIIHFKDKQWDAGRRFRDREIYLSRNDMSYLILFTKLKKTMNTKSYQLNRNLKAWAEKAGLNPEEMDSQTIRRTRMAWLLFLFPQFEERIVTSMDFYKDVTPYRSIPFTKADNLAMIYMLGDWSGANTNTTP